jgi:short-subunit dehydrogenase
VINLFAKVADAPQATLRLDPDVTEPVTNLLRTGLKFFPPAKRVVKMGLGELGIPAGILTYVNYPTTFDSTDAQAALEGSGIEVPPLETYADRVWDYWERNLDPDLFKDRSLSGAVRGKVVLITGASSGIGKAAAVKVADAGATVLLVARSLDKLEETKAEIEQAGGVAHIHRCDMSDVEDVERMAEEVLTYHGHVDILINNAGRSIRRSVELAYDRFHDYERTMQVNYFGAVRLILALMPAMVARKSGHIINISSIGTQTNPPRFSAYVASKAALDAFSRVIASEVIDDGIHLTTVHMPLVRTPMIAPTRMYDVFPAITPEEAADMIAKAIVGKPKKVATRLGTFGELLYAVAPKASDKILNTAYGLFPESQAAKGKGEEAPDRAPTTEALAFAHLMKGVHW